MLKLLARIKEQINSSTGCTLQEILISEAEVQGELIQTEDAQKSIEAFKTKLKGSANRQTRQEETR